MFDCAFMYEELYLYMKLWSYPIIVFLIRQEEIKEIKTRMIKNYLQSIFFLNLCVGFQLQPMRLGKLENLDLSFNRLNSSILSILSGLSSLKSLDLSFNMLTGSGIIHSFYLNASHDILLIILFLYQQKWGRLYIQVMINCINWSYLIIQFYNIICVHVLFFLCVINLRIIYQLNNSISSILIIFSFYILCISWAHYDLLIETTFLQVLRSYHHIWGNSRTWTWAIIYSTTAFYHICMDFLISSL